MSADESTAHGDRSLRALTVGLVAGLWLAAGLVLSQMTSFFGHVSGSFALLPLLVAVAGAAALAAAVRASARGRHGDAKSFVFLAAVCFAVWLVMATVLLA